MVIMTSQITGNSTVFMLVVQHDNKWNTQALLLVHCGKNHCWRVDSFIRKIKSDMISSCYFEKKQYVIYFLRGVLYAELLKWHISIFIGELYSKMYFALNNRCKPLINRRITYNIFNPTIPCSWHSINNILLPLFTDVYPHIPPISLI